jgi:hypothetical protein
LEERRKRLRRIVDRLPEGIRYSETFTVTAATLVRAVRENGLEGIVAKRAGSTYRSGRSGDWLKWRANRGQELVIGGYVPASNTFDSLLVGYYEGRDSVYAGRIRAGLADSRRALLSHFAGLGIELGGECPKLLLQNPSFRSLSAACAIDFGRNVARIGAQRKGSLEGANGLLVMSSFHKLVTSAKLAYYFCSSCNCKA